MSEELLNHNQEKPPHLTGEEHPGAAGGVGAERSEPERSDGERSGAPTPPSRAASNGFGRRPLGG